MARDSLIQRAAQQPELMSSAEMAGDFFAATESKGEFTGERLAAQEPRLYHAVVSLLAEGVGLIRIGRLLGVSAHTVAAVRDRERSPIATEKQELGRLALTGARMAMESVGEDLSDPVARAQISTRDKALIGAILTDKALLLHGEATVRLEVAMAEPDHDGYNRYLAGLRAIGGGGETGGEKGTAATGATAPGTDKESGVS